MRNARQDGNVRIEQILFLLGKFCVSDEMYHELAITYNDLPKSYIRKYQITENI